MNASVSQPIKVLCVDDSALIRSLLKAIVDEQPDMTMVACAPDPLVARELIKRHDPDVLTLDVEMPKMDGLDFLEKIMRLRPMPVVMVSSLTERGSEITLQALDLGAVDFVAKPKIGIRDGMLEYGEDILEKIRAASCARIRRSTTQQPPSKVSATPRLSSEQLFVVGASTGGTEALRELLVPLPADAPATLVTQHMPAGFTAPFARRLNTLCQVQVKEAEDGERVLPGHVYIAPGGESHMKLARSGTNYVIALEAGEPVNRHRPSVDVLFDSAAVHAGRNAIGLLLTGMGKDGARGLLRMFEAGARTIAQDEASSVVFGMPNEAIALGAAMHVLPIDSMCAGVMDILASDERHAVRI